MSIGLSLNARRVKERFVPNAEYNSVILLRESEPWVVFERAGRQVERHMAKAADIYSVLSRLEALLFVLPVRSPLTSNWKLTCAFRHLLVLYFSINNTNAYSTLECYNMFAIFA